MRIADANYSVVDLETTGFDAAIEKVVEFASIDFKLHGPREIRDSLLNPGKPISIESKSVHNITDKMVEGKPTLEEFLATYQFKADVYVAHQAEFDFKFVPPPGLMLCTRRLAMKMWPDLTKSNNSYLRYFLGLDEIPELDNIKTHRAVADAMITTYNLEKMLDYLIVQQPEMQIEDVVAWTNTPIFQKNIQFGKYKGQPWANVPGDYMEWIKKNMTNLDPDSLYTLNYYLNEQPF